MMNSEKLKILTLIVLLKSHRKLRSDVENI